MVYDGRSNAISNNNTNTNVTNNDSNNNEIIYEEDRPISLLQFPTTDPYAERQWALKPEVGGIDLINAWYTFPCIDGGSYFKTPIVAIFDTGVQTDHPDLRHSLWVNERELYGRPGVDDDGNGYIDDIHGFNFVDNNGNVEDTHYHGTHCAGIIAAGVDNFVGTSGVFWKVKLMIIKIMDGNGRGSMSSAIAGLNYALKMGASVTSHSWGGEGYSEIFMRAMQAGTGTIFHVAAAGNDGKNTDTSPVFPGSFYRSIKNFMSVCATDENGKMASFSNYGMETVGLCAPGVNIVSTCPKSQYCLLSGTSQATPFVSGIAAMLLYKNEILGDKKRVFPEFLGSLRETLLKSVRQNSSFKGTVNSGGIVSAALAVEST
jgi:subtilisin family serine protease